MTPIAAHELSLSKIEMKGGSNNEKKIPAGERKAGSPQLSTRQCELRGSRKKKKKLGGWKNSMISVSNHSLEAVGGKGSKGGGDMKGGI